MGEKVVLNDATREVAKAVTKDSVVTCTKTSAPDVYVNAITPKQTTSLHAGDSVPVEKMLPLRLHIFRKNPTEPFGASAEIDISPA
jgi:hypothetical protein